MKRLIFTTILFFLANNLFAQPSSFTWAKQIGGTSGEFSVSVKIDAFGNVYTTGSFAGTVDFDPGAGIYNLVGGGIFILKIDASGNFVWAKQFGGGAGRSIALDANGNVYTTGYFTGTVDFDPGPGIYELISAGAEDIFVSKLDASGNFLWAKALGGSSADLGYSITVDNSGNVFTVGYFRETADFDPGSGTYYLTSNGFSDIFVSKIDGSGNFAWAKQFGGSGDDRSASIGVDGSGNVYTIGSFIGTVDFDPGSGIYNLTANANTAWGDIYLTKLDNSGNFLWAKHLGGLTALDAFWCVIGLSWPTIEVDLYGNVYATGGFRGTIDFNPGSGIYNLTSADGHDIFVLKLDVLGNFVWAKQMGGVSTGGFHQGDFGRSIRVDNNGNVYTTGTFNGTADFDPGPGIYELTSPPNTDNNFISKLDGSGNFILALKIENRGGPHGESYSIDVDNYGNVLTTGIFKDTVDFDPGSGIYNLTSNGPSWDIFVLKLRSYASPYQLPYITAQNAIKLKGNQFTIADPIQLGTGSYSYTHNDFKIPTLNGSVNFTRFYNSLNANIIGPLGYGWSHTYNYYLDNKQDTSWNIHYPDGHVSTFIPMNNLGQSFPIFSGTFDSLQKNNNNSWSLFTKEKQQYHFDPSGKLDSIIDLNNNVTRLYYTAGLLDSIVAPGGRSLIITYSGNKITSVKDPLNRICSYSYDVNNNLTTVVDASTGTATFTYDTAHRILTALNPLNNIIVDNTYDSSGKVISQKDAYNQLTSIVYNSPSPGDATVTNPDNSQIIAHHDAFIRKTSEKDELDFTKSYTYDANSNEKGFTNENNQTEKRLFDNYGNLITDTLPGNKITNITYNSFNSPVQVTDAKGNQKTFFYNSSNNNLDSIRYPDNSVQVFYYNNFGQVIQSIDGNGNPTTYTYSPAGDLLSTQTFAGIKQFAYDAAGRKISETDEKGHTESYVYDNNDNILLVTDALGRTIQNTYDANNQLLTVKDKKGFITIYTYDSKGRKISSTDPKGGITAYTYDVRDNLITVTDPENNIVTYNYDAKGRKTSSTNALGTTQYQYDGVGNLLKLTDPTGRITDYTFTPTNKKQSQADGLNNTTNYSYDLNDNLMSVTDPLNRITANGYDVMNRLVSVTDAANKTTEITYDYNGNKKTVVDPNNHTQTYDYDGVNRLISYQDAAGNNYTYGYDSAGNNITLTKPTGTIAKIFDAVNRVITVNNSTGDNYQFTYDNNDNIATMSNNIGTTSMAYDSLNQLKQYLDPFNKTVSFTYDAAGNRTSIVYPGNKTVSYTYDNANNLKTVTDWLSHTFTYTYDSAGRTTRLLYPNGAYCNYAFDNAGRLISKINRLGTNTIITGSTFTLDAVGNRIAEQRLAQIPSITSSLSRVYSYANDDRMLSDSVWNFVNDNSGNRTSETNGSQTASYVFSVDNLLNSRMDTAGTNCNYSYNVSGNRIAKIAGAISEKYVLDISNNLSQVLQITDENGVLKSNYIYGLGLLETIDAADNALYYHFDAQHNTILLTGEDSTIKDSYTYNPFGTMLSHTGTTTQPFTFLGEYGVEQESHALYYARARYYDAPNGRFLSKDAFDYNLNNPQTINRYVYATNNPISIFDYTGLYGDQDNNFVNIGKFEIPGFSYQLNLITMTKYSDWWHKKTHNWWYPIISPTVPILGKVGYLNSAVRTQNYINDYKNNEVGLPETGLRIALEYYPTAAKAAGFAVAGPTGEYLAGVVASESKLFGEWLVNKTRLGNKLTDYLASKYFTY